MLKTMLGGARLAACGLGAVCLAPFPALAEPLGDDLSQLLGLMEQSHPSLSASTALREASAAEIEIAGALDDPQFEVGSEVSAI